MQRRQHASIMRVGYQPPTGYGLDLEVFSVAELRGRVDEAHFHPTQRIDFHMLIYVTQGRFDYCVDFEPIPCRPGSLLALRPEQALHFNMQAKWDGWLVIFRPEFLAPMKSAALVDDLKACGSLEALATHISLNTKERHAVLQGILQMRQDAGIAATTTALHPLLRHQLYTLLLRLYLAHGQQQAHAGASAASLLRFRKFRLLLDSRFATQHQIAGYANALGCSEKSLTRATLDVAGIPAKAFIAARINLEAKRLLAQTALPISAIAGQVGFDDVANFTRFFRRGVGCTPGEFRRRYEV